MARAARRKRFELWHSIAGCAALVIVETYALLLAPALSDAIICVASIVGSVMLLYVATEIVEEVTGAPHVLSLLSALVSEFIVFFALQYRFALWCDPSSFPALPGDPVSLLLHSTMVFVFNPLWLPQDAVGRLLLLVNTLAALGLVLFVLQNVWQFRRTRSKTS